MKLIAITALVFALAGCLAEDMQACHNSCTAGMKEFRENQCTCNSVAELCRGVHSTKPESETPP